MEVLDTYRSSESNVFFEHDISKSLAVNNYFIVNSELVNGFATPYQIGGIRMYLQKVGVICI